MTKTDSALLFDLPEAPPLACKGSSVFQDPAFASNKKAPVHRWVPWIAGFSREFVQDAFDRHLKKPSTVLDSFAGVGTTLVEAILAGHTAIGFEINPYAALACRVKLSAYRSGPDDINNLAQGLESFYHEAITLGKTPHSKAPPGFKTRAEFYSVKVLPKVLLVQDFIASIKDDKLREITQLAFASTMVTYSNYSYEPSLGRRVSAGRDNVEDFPVGSTVAQKLRDMADDVAWMQLQLKDKQPPSVVYNESYFDSRNRLRASSVDLLVTSPPYVNNYHYNRNTRPHLYWLGYAEKPDDLKPLETSNFGKFWQTVRNNDSVELDFDSPDKEIVDCLRELRSRTPEKGVYGGNGWANYAATYFNDCHRFALATKRALKRRGTALVVVGNSILQGVMVPTDRFLGRIAEAAGLELVDIHSPRSTRVGNSIIKSDVRSVKAKKSDRLYESVVELRKR